MEDGEGSAGYMPGYVSTGKERQIKEVYGDWVHSNDRVHLSGGVKANQEWKDRWRTLVVMPARRYDTPSGRVGRRSVQVLVAELAGVRQCCWNMERFIVFQTMTLQWNRHVAKSWKIQQRIDQRLYAWEGTEHTVLVEDRARTCEQYLSTSWGGVPEALV